MNVIETQKLTDVLRLLLAGNGFAGRALASVEREANVYSSTFPSEIVRCSFSDGSRVALLCKHQFGTNYPGHGHWGDLEYEGLVYRELLMSQPLPTAHFHGLYSDADAGWTFLAVEYLEDAMRVNKLEQPQGMGAAARWIAEFHRSYEYQRNLSQRVALKQYDRDYFMGWASRTSAFAGPLHERFPWLASLCGNFERALDALLSAPSTVIHGEYQPHNVLGRDGRVYPVDWQSTAIGAGEIDLVALLDGPWDEETVKHCINQYQITRWPNGAPDTFEPAMTAAKIYWQLRWLGDMPELTVDADLLWRFDQLRAATEQRGIFA